MTLLFTTARSLGPIARTRQRPEFRAGKGIQVTGRVVGLPPCTSKWWTAAVDGKLGERARAITQTVFLSQIGGRVLPPDQFERVALCACCGWCISCGNGQCTRADV